MYKYAYEEKYGEKVIYCTRHHMSGIDSCILCEEEEEANKEMVVCITCRYESKEEEDFVEVPIKGTGNVTFNKVCQTCYDNYTKEATAVRDAQNTQQTERLTYAINTDYLE